MVDARWGDVRVDFESAVRHFVMSGKLFEKNGFDDFSLEGYQAKMALMHSMQAGYTSLENGMKRIFNILGEELPSGDSSHSDLIKRAAREIENQRPAIISQNTYKLADEVRRFRHVAVRTYDDFVPEESEKSIEAAKNLSKILMEELNLFASIIDPESENDGDGDGSGGGAAGGPPPKLR